MKSNQEKDSLEALDDGSRICIKVRGSDGIQYLPLTLLDAARLGMYFQLTLRPPTAPEPKAGKQ